MFVAAGTASILGNSYPITEILVGGGFGLFIMMSICVTFLVSSARTRRIVLCVLVAGDLLAILGLFLFNYIVTPKIYDRESLKIQRVVSPDADLTGTWVGTWTDPRKEFTEMITLTLTQSGNSMSGTIVDEGGTQWRIIEGVVSGSELNLFYDRDFGWPGAGATLLGSIEGDTISGNYYGHERPRRGSSSSGPWEAVRSTVKTDPSTSDE